MSRSRPALGVDPLDALLGDAGTTGRHRRLVIEPAPPRRVRATFHLPLDLVDEARNATVALSGPPTRLTLARLVENALRREVQRLRDVHNGGSPFPLRDADLVGGRPIGS